MRDLLRRTLDRLGFNKREEKQVLTIAKKGGRNVRSSLRKDAERELKRALRNTRKDINKIKKQVTKKSRGSSRLSRGSSGKTKKSKRR